jgi:capsular exopolysaccharide synthesis family protein
MKGGGTLDDVSIEGQEPFKAAWPVTNEPVRAEVVRPAVVAAPASAPVPVPEPDEILDTPSALRLSIASSWKERLAIGTESGPVLLEQFRRLAGTLHEAHQSRDLRSVMVTSASSGDGKTLTAINLALVLSESYRYRVLLIDADLRRPSITGVVNIAGGSGLSDALRAPTPQKLALAQLTSRLTLLPAGGPTMNSIEALVSPRMKQILDEASTKFDWVILDAPPLGPTADARLLSQMAGGTLFVIRAGKSQSTEVQRAIDTLGRDSILGIVLNDVEQTENEESYYYYSGNPLDRKR